MYCMCPIHDQENSVEMIVDIITLSDAPTYYKT